MTSAELRDYYKSYNKTYFGNRLPKRLRVYFGKTAPNHVAETRITNWVPQYIVLRHELQFLERIACTTLLHEMCHVEFPKTPQEHFHGSRFKRRMRKLVRQGAFDNLW